MLEQTNNVIMGKTGGEEVCLLKYEIQCAKYIIEKDIIEEKWNEIHIFAWIGASSFGLGGYN